MRTHCSDVDTKTICMVARRWICRNVDEVFATCCAALLVMDLASLKVVNVLLFSVRA